MSDDHFIREVNEELRKDQAKALWDRYGPIALAAAVLIVLATAAYVGYNYWIETRAGRSGDAFSQALRLANDGKNDEALKAFETLEAEGHGAYPVLARLRSATVLIGKGDFSGAVAAFDAVSNDGSIPPAIRDIARLRAGLVLVDHGTYADVSSRVETLAADTNPLRHSARELLALSAWKDGRSADALKLTEQISADDAAPRNVRERANLLSELIRGSGNAS
ncbi:MAG: tetratricopeptide repeat protein [Mesorhizobium sp.]|jgi:hypothetical protein